MLKTSLQIRLFDYGNHECEVCSMPQTTQTSLNSFTTVHFCVPYCSSSFNVKSNQPYIHFLGQIMKELSSQSFIKK